ncbi:hypothetical protein ACH5RR_030089 [Cinchona calisaya]|uniref:Uncharacterized protein n=1 Tax=Cinchona calisaya TaxID=153742 RepID=A0ABD2YTP7_9GENT
MAHGELVILRDELRNLSRILHKIVDLKNFQAELFIEKVGEVMRILEMEGTPCLPDQLVEDIVTLAELPIEDFVHGQPGFQMVEYSVPTVEVLEIVEEIGLIENKLEKFLDETDLYNVWDDLRNNLAALLPCREVVRNLLQASQKLKEDLNFFHQVCTETGSLCSCLRVLVILPRKNLGCSTELAEGIRDAVNKALNATGYPEQDCLLSHFVKLGNTLSGNYSGRSEELKKNPIDKMARELFDGKNGMRLVFLETLGKLHSFKRKIYMISKKRGRECIQLQNDKLGRGYIQSRNDKLGREDLQSRNDKLGREDTQSWNASIRVLYPMTYCRLVFPTSKENKRRRNGSPKKTSEVDSHT